MFSQRGGSMGRGTGVAAVAAIGIALVAGSARATTIASDNAGNYSGSGWTNGSDGGTGFGAWSLSASGGTGGFGGNFIGNPTTAGITNFGTEAFGQFANSDSGAFANADRSLDAALNVGDVFSFQWAVNFDSNGAVNKGFNIYTGGVGATQLINVNMGGSSTISINSTDTGFVYGTDPMTWSFEMTDATTLNVTATPRGSGSNYTGNFTVGGAPDSFRFYAGNLNAGDQRQPYFNNFQVVAVPEPAMAPLVIFGLLVPAVLSYRKMRRGPQTD